jgi:Putative MetA-pathway of phenol degradation
LDQSRGSRRAVYVRGYAHGPRFVRHATRRNRWFTGRRAPSASLYVANTVDWGCRNTSPVSCLGITIPVVTWSTPWTILGARGAILLGDPVDRGRSPKYLLQPKHIQSGSVRAIGLEPRQRVWLQLCHPQISPCPAPFGLNDCNPDFLNIDLTATKKFGKWEFGGVAYGSTDLTRPIGNYQKQGDIAVGAPLATILVQSICRLTPRRKWSSASTGAGTRAAGSA